VMGVFSMRLDITELVETRRRLEEVIRELEIRNREVERANRLKSEFLASMSHELRTPLTSIIGFSELLAEQELTPKQKRQVNRILDGARHLLALISDILDLSKIEAGRLELHKETFGLKEALGQVTAALAPLVAAKRLELADQTEEDVALYADRMRFRQILYNLLSNAVKFTPEGGRISIGSTQREGSIYITVSDTGVGIPAGELEAIFNEFHQAGATTSGLKEGTGLGLAITRRLVRMHGGEIGAESVEGQGSRFTFHIPMEAGE
jgi:signal transduction histidine kinase